MLAKFRPRFMGREKRRRKGGKRREEKPDPRVTILFSTSEIRER